MLLQWLHAAPLCWVLSPWKPFCDQSCCKRLVFVGKLDAWTHVSQVLWSLKREVCLWLIYMSRPPNTQWNKPLRWLSQEHSPPTPPLPGLAFWVAMQSVCQSALIDSVHSWPVQFVWALLHICLTNSLRKKNQTGFRCKVFSCCCQLLSSWQMYINPTPVKPVLLWVFVRDIKCLRLKESDFCKVKK